MERTILVQSTLARHAEALATARALEVVVVEAAERRRGVDVTTVVSR